LKSFIQEEWLNLSRDIQKAIAEQLSCCSLMTSSSCKLNTNFVGTNLPGNMACYLAVYDWMISNKLVIVFTISVHAMLELVIITLACLLPVGEDKSYYCRTLPRKPNKVHPILVKPYERDKQFNENDLPLDVIRPTRKWAKMNSRRSKTTK